LFHNIENNNEGQVIKEPMKVIEEGRYITRMVLSEDDFEKEPNTQRNVSQITIKVPAHPCLLQHYS
jgi:hypothetical protein